LCVVHKYNDIDPFGEEDWDEGMPFDKFYIFRARLSYMSPPKIFLARSKTKNEVYSLNL